MKLSNCITATFLNAITLSVSAIDMDACRACHQLGSHITQKLSLTQNRANEDIPKGGPVGPDGEKPTVKYGNSERRLLDVLEGACNMADDKSVCNEQLHKLDENISQWFKGGRDSSFEDAVCGVAIPGCSASAISKADAVKIKVEVDDGKNSKKKSSAGEGKFSTGSSKAKSLIDPVKQLANTMIARVKGNFFRVKVLSKQFYAEIFPLLKKRDWPTLIATFKNPDFYKKYWYMAFAYFMAVYLLLSVYDSLFGAGPAPRSINRTQQRGTRNSRKTAIKKD